MTFFPKNHLHAVSRLDCGGREGSREITFETTAVLGVGVSMLEPGEAESRLDTVPE